MVDGLGHQGHNLRGFVLCRRRISTEACVSRWLCRARALGEIFVAESSGLDSFIDSVSPRLQVVESGVRRQKH